MLHFLEVAKVGSQSVKKYEHLDQALQKVHMELLVIRDVDDLANSDNIMYLIAKYYQIF